MFQRKVSNCDADGLILRRLKSYEIGFINIELHFSNGEGEGEAAFFSAKCLADLMESATPCHVMTLKFLGSYRVWDPLRLTVLAAKSEDYTTTAPQHLQFLVNHTL